MLQNKPMSSYLGHLPLRLSSIGLVVHWGSFHYLKIFWNCFEFFAANLEFYPNKCNWFPALRIHLPLKLFSMEVISHSFKKDKTIFLSFHLRTHKSHYARFEVILPREVIIHLRLSSFWGFAKYVFVILSLSLKLEHDPINCCWDIPLLIFWGRL